MKTIYLAVGERNIAREQLKKAKAENKLESVKFWEGYILALCLVIRNEEGK